MEIDKHSNYFAMQSVFASDHKTGHTALTQGVPFGGRRELIPDEPNTIEDTAKLLTYDVVTKASAN
jgi:hypothetical protein